MPAVQKCGLDDYFVSGKTLDDLQSLTVDTLPDPEPEWETPIHLDDPAGPPFPLASLPGVTGTMVAAVAEETQTPPDMAATMALATISAAAGGKYEVVLAEQGWCEPVHIMTVAVAEPGSRKSGVIRKLTAPLAAYEARVQPEERVALADWDSRRRVLDKQLAAAESAASKTGQDADAALAAEGDRQDAVRALEDHEQARPRVTRLVMDDATPEAVKSMLAEQGGAVAVMSAESAFFANTAGGRYTQNGAPNLDVILNGHAADAIVVDRKGRPNEVIARACLTIGVMVQPRVIRDLGTAPGFVARGAAARLLPSIPVDIVGQRRIDVTPVPTEIAASWDAVIQRVAARRPDRRDGGAVPWPITLAADAAKIFHDYRERHEPEMRAGGAYADIRDWAGKQPGAVLRVAGLLHVGEHERPETAPISPDTLRQAIAIVEYFAAHARVMYRLLHGRSEHGDARAVLTAIRELGSSTTRRDVHRKLHNQIAFATAADLDRPLALLEEYGYIRRQRRSTGGRSSEIIELNPLLDHDKSDKSEERRIDAAPSVRIVMVEERDERQPAADPTEPVVALPTPNRNDAADGEWRMTL